MTIILLDLFRRLLISACTIYIANHLDFFPVGSLLSSPIPDNIDEIPKREILKQVIHEEWRRISIWFAIAAFMFFISGNGVRYMLFPPLLGELSSSIRSWLLIGVLFTILITIRISLSRRYFDLVSDSIFCISVALIVVLMLV
jgi:hypothetical protein